MATKPWSVTITGNSTTAGYPTYVADQFVSTFEIGFGCTVNSSAITWALEYTFDDLSASTWTSTGLTWFASTAATAQSTSLHGVLGVPCTAVRPNITSASSTGTLTVRLVQSG